ncbi:MAG: hypothetical protein KZQ73_06445 [Candidatus Thiodiazotropha sp. (ex Semelilucina semeliformis)]|nr:hypothetical protein [Candidatus Thiodiazotropha sp. (ex Semelilucina semeliformis)]
MKKEHFKCPDCESLLTSNSKKVLKQSLVVAMIVWLLSLIGIQHYSGSWGYAAVVSIEAGGILSAMLAALYYRLVVRLKRAV